ncbi:MAG: hypothetical protein HKO91_01805 [Desulfobacterales bacterium]|nr:hypothetical protein [Desulfobacterales bacterium]
MITGDLGYVGKKRLQELREEIGDVERMLKAMIRSLENKHLNRNSKGIPHGFCRAVVLRMPRG